MSFSDHTTSAAWPLSVRASLRIGCSVALIGLAACSSKPQELTVRTVEEPIQRAPVMRPLPDPAPITVLPVDWIVVTPGTIPEGDFVIFGMDADSYENLSLNTADILRWVTEAKVRLKTYREALQNEQR